MQTGVAKSVTWYINDPFGENLVKPGQSEFFFFFLFCFLIYILHYIFQNSLSPLFGQIELSTLYGMLIVSINI